MFSLSDGVNMLNTLKGIILYLNFFDDRLHDLQHEPLNLIAEAYFSLYPEKKHSYKIFSTGALPERL